MQKKFVCTRKSNDNNFWPGHPLDKIRLYALGRRGQERGPGRPRRGAGPPGCGRGRAGAATAEPAVPGQRPGRGGCAPPPRQGAPARPAPLAEVAPGLARAQPGGSDARQVLAASYRTRAPGPGEAPIRALGASPPDRTRPAPPPGAGLVARAGPELALRSRGGARTGQDPSRIP